MRNDFDRIIDMQESLNNIQRYTARGANTFFEDELIQTWVLYHLQILGEAARSMSQEMKDKHSAIDWQRIIDFRNFVVHEYFRVDLAIVWRIVEHDLPSLKAEVDLMLKIYI